MQCTGALGLDIQNPRRYNNHHIHIVRLSLTLFFLHFCSDLDKILHKGGSLDPDNRKNTEVWLPLQPLPW